MQVATLLQRVRRIEIKARGLSRNLLAGQYRSAFKGRGMAFSEVREYIPGDDIRDIDWNVTARYTCPHVKVYEEERELTIMLLVDVSASLDFGSTSESKRELVATLMATLAIASTTNNDMVGLILYSDHVERYIPAGKGRKHVLHLISEVLTFEPMRQRTCISSSLDMLSRVVKKRCTAFIISDFITEAPTPSEAALIRRVAHKHDLLALRVTDLRDQTLSPMGITLFVDPESGDRRWINTSSRRVRDAYAERYATFAAQWDQLMSEYGIRHIVVETGEDVTPKLIQLISHRS